MTDDLPSVGGTLMEKTLAAHVLACRVLLRDEQAKIVPDNALVAVLCDSVRMAREYERSMKPTMIIGAPDTIVTQQPPEGPAGPLLAKVRAALRDPDSTLAEVRADMVQIVKLLEGALVNYQHDVGSLAIASQPDAMRGALDELQRRFPGLGATLFVFEYGGPGKGLMYGSTAPRSDMIRAVSEWLNRVTAERN